jgi:quercetin dioxygenase-like cupin family protein
MNQAQAWGHRRALPTRAAAGGPLKECEAGGIVGVDTGHSRNEETPMPVKAAVRTSSAPASPYAQRARYVCNENGFAFSYPPVPARQFLAERDRAFDPALRSCAIELDASDALGSAHPATTPTVLCRYLKIRAGETLRATRVAPGEVCYVMSGRGESRNGSDMIEWSEGDVFCLPGGAETAHRASADALLFTVTDEPLLAYAGMRAAPPGQGSVEAVLWPAAEIERRFEAVWNRPITERTTGAAVQFSTRRTEPSFATTPFLNVSINTLAAGCDQRPHRHNGVAVTLAIQGDGIHSVIDGKRIEWSTGAAQITPATAMHSHHNRGDQRMRSLVIQDEGLHLYTRTPGFSFD